MARKFSWKTTVTFLLAAFFFVGAIGNFSPPEQIVTEYANWGYPSWFHNVTGAFELAAAGLLMIRRTRFLGGMTGAIPMVGAGVTLILHGAYAHALAPLTVLLVCVAVCHMYKSP
ncbi:DoxX family protein [Burkholderia lata]|uniref:DoxX family protein n=1 Tax=Burkholderia lata (strain ATCC 17760 / DSM 23089 / LMG 22485 / NCIMB 9086 / R18194 / 383) TaxID=482957 RepID=UPI00145401AD|nr:DoxX family protein [Burkholderia lata]VWB87779.1 hypothetical protein BLA15816_04218 [Burkholderia lata]